MGLRVRLHRKEPPIWRTQVCSVRTRPRTDTSTRSFPGRRSSKGNDDTFPGLAWVNELQPNRYGLYHMPGNVWEWVSDNFLGGVGTGTSGTIRGGGYNTASERELLSSYRRSLASNAREDGVGFRYVLARAFTVN